MSISLQETHQDPKEDDSHPGDNLDSVLEGFERVNNSSCSSFLSVTLGLRTHDGMLCCDYGCLKDSRLLRGTESTGQWQQGHFGMKRGWVSARLRTEVRAPAGQTQRWTASRVSGKLWAHHGGCRPLCCLKPHVQEDGR